MAFCSFVLFWRGGVFFCFPFISPVQRVRFGDENKEDAVRLLQKGAETIKLAAQDGTRHLPG